MAISNFGNKNFPYNRSGNFNRKKSHGYTINEEITYSTIRITGEGIESKICSQGDALELAKHLGLDLILISADALPPVCKIADLQKFLYDKKKKEKENKNSSKPMKEIKLGPNIGEHDLSYKIKQSLKFLEEGHKVKASIQFKGREMAHKELGQKVLLEFILALESAGKPEFVPKMDGKIMYTILTPKKA